MNKYYIYYHRDPRPEYFRWKRYIGKGKGRRAFQLTNRYCAHKKWLNHLKSLGLKPIIEIVEYFENEIDALNKEIELISKYKNKGYIMYNMTDGGDGVVGISGKYSYWYGKKRSAETKEKISKNKKGKQNKPVSESNKTRQISLITKQKISNSLKGNKRRYGKKSSEQTRLKNSQAALGNKNSCKKILCLNNNTVYDSVKQACEINNLSYTLVILVLKGKQKNTKGFYFKYLE